MVKIYLVISFIFLCMYGCGSSDRTAMDQVMTKSSNLINTPLYRMYDSEFRVVCYYGEGGRSVSCIKE